MFGETTGTLKCGIRKIKKNDHAHRQDFKIRCQISSLK